MDYSTEVITNCEKATVRTQQYSILFADTLHYFQVLLPEDAIESIVDDLKGSIVDSSHRYVYLSALHSTMEERPEDLDIRIARTTVLIKCYWMAFVIL
jgi:hypothetical protein